MSKEEKKKLYKEFENDKEASFIYFKAHKIYLLCFIGVVYSIIATIFDIVKDVKYYAYLMDAFLFIFCIIFGIKMSKFKKSEFNKYLKKHISNENSCVFFCIIETSFCIILDSMMQNNYFILL